MFTSNFTTSALTIGNGVPMNSPSRLWSRGRYGRHALGLVGMLAFLLAFTCSAATITNVSVVNVTPTGFSILWRTAANSTPSVEVFTSSAGTNSLAGQLAIEAFPLHTGNPDAATPYDRRLSLALVRQKTAGAGLMLVKVLGCRPGTSYFYRLSSTPPAGAIATYPESGLLPSVTTERENSFVMDDQQLIIDVPGVDTMGRVVTLTHSNANFAIAAVVGDGVGTNQVFFNANDLFALSGTGNIAPSGPQVFTAKVLGPNSGETVAQFFLSFSNALQVGRANFNSIGTEFLALSLGSTVLRTGQTSSVPIGFSSSVGLSDFSIELGLKADYLTNLTLLGAASEIDPATISFSPQTNGVTLLKFKTLGGQLLLGTKSIGQFGFTSIPGKPSAFVPLKIQQMVVRKPDNSVVGNLTAQSGRAVLIGNESLLEMTYTNGSRGLMLYAKPNSAYALEYATNLSNPTIWMRLPPVIVTSMVTPLSGVSLPQGQLYYRALETFADPPFIQASINPDRSRSLTLYGKPGTQYTVQYKTNLSNVVPWLPLLNTTLSNSFGTVAVPGTNPVVYYRLKKN